MTKWFDPLCQQTWQILYPRKKKSCTGRDYLAFRIHDGESSYIAHAWAGQYQGPEQLFHGQRMHITGYWVTYNAQPLLRCRTLSPTEAEPQALRRSKTRVRLLLYRMHPTLKQFVRQVFSDERLLQGFMSLPASTGYHHAYPGGLFIHSVDAAWKCYRNPELKGQDKDTAIVAALLHDVGKVNSYTPEGILTAHGRFVDHDAETLSLLKSALKWLDTQDTQLGLLLRHYLTWHPRKRGIPQHIGALWVRTADQASTASECQRRGTNEHSPRQMANRT